MTPEFLSGLNAAWAVAAFALAVFFAVSFFIRRRDAEFLLFSILCLTLGVVAIGMSLVYVAKNPADWAVAAGLGPVGAFAAAAANVHFVSAFTRARLPRWVQPVIYAVTVGFQTVYLSGYWWLPGSPALVPKWGLYQAAPTLVGSLGYGFIDLQLLFSVVLLFRAWRQGMREAGWGMLGASLVLAAAANDSLNSLGVDGMIYLAPAAFLVYALGIAISFPTRYGDAAGELETAESHLERAAQDLRSSHAELKDVRTELDLKAPLAAVGELAAAIAHEVRNPLAVIVNACANLRRPNGASQDRAVMLGIVEEEAERLNRLVTDLVRFARPMGTRRGHVPLGPVIARSLGMAHADYGVQGRCTGASELAALADPDLLALVLDQLVENACQAMRRGGEVAVDVRAVELHGRELVCISVEDSGHGMNSEILEKASSPFFSTREGGTGLGLTIVKRVVEAHGGSIDFLSQAGVGTRVELRFPSAPGA